MRSRESEPVSDAEASALFADLKDAPALVLAVSGGPDSTALMLLAARWRAAMKQGPKLIAVTVDHGLRPEAKKEAAAVGALARKLKIAHRILRWTGKKPKTGVQQAARAARYRLLADAARKARATHVLTAHTLDDQAETVLIRMARGSGIAGLGAMSRCVALPVARRAPSPLRGEGRGEGGRDSRFCNPSPGALRAPTSPNGRGEAELLARASEIILLRPFLDLPKSRLIATLKAAQVSFAEDPSNRDPRFTRVRLRDLSPVLAEEGLDARRLALLARRLKRADDALEQAVAAAEELLVRRSGPAAVAYDRAKYALMPEEIALRLLGRGIARYATEGPVELGKLEALKAALDEAHKSGAGFRRSLAGAIVTLARAEIVVEPAPPRRSTVLTKRRQARATRGKSR
jgi:tRNA(Ile)-lysidine synthase